MKPFTIFSFLKHFLIYVGCAALLILLQQTAAAAWQASDIDFTKFDDQALRQVQGEVTVELAKNPANAVKTYNDFAEIFGQYIKQHNVLYKLEKPNTYSPYKVLTITPSKAANAAPANAYAEKLRKLGYALKLMGPGEIDLYQTVLLLPAQRYVVVGARAVSNLDNFLDDPRMNAAMKVIQNLTQPALAFLPHTSTRLLETTQLLPTPHPELFRRTIAIDKAHQIFVVHPMHTAERPLDFVVLYQRSQTINEVLQSLIRRYTAQNPDHLDEVFLSPKEQNNLQQSYEKLYWRALQLANNLTAAMYVMATHPERVVLKRSMLDQLQIAVHFTPEYPDEVFIINLLWPSQNSVPQDSSEILASPYLQVVYRYVFDLLKTLTPHREVLIQEQPLSLAQVASATAGWSSFSDTATRAWDATQNQPWRKEEFLQEMLMNYPFILAGLRQPALSNNYSIVLEERLRQRLAEHSAPREQRAFYKNFLEELAIHLKQKQIDQIIHDEGISPWMEFPPSKRSLLNELAALLAARGFSLQYMGAKHLQNERIYRKLIHINYREKRIKIGHKALRRIGSLFVDPAIKAIIQGEAKVSPATVPAVLAKHDPALAWVIDRPALQTNFGTAHDTVKDVKNFKVISTLESKIPIVILHRHQSFLNYSDIYHRTYALYYNAQALSNAEHLEQISNRSRKRVIEQLRKDYYSLLMTIAWHLLDWHVVLYTLGQKDAAANLELALNDGHLQITMMPDKKLPQLSYQIEFLWPANESLPLKAAYLIKHRNLQRLYHYHVALWELLIKGQDAMQALYDDTANSVATVLQHWAQLPTLPQEISKKITKDLTARELTWKTDLPKLQATIIDYLKETYERRAEIPNKVERCVHNFLNKAAAAN